MITQSKIVVAVRLLFFGILYCLLIGVLAELLVMPVRFIDWADNFNVKRRKCKVCYGVGYVPKHEHKYVSCEDTQIICVTCKGEGEVEKR